MHVRDLIGPSPSNVITIHPRATLAEAADLLMKHKIGGLPVVRRSGELVGFLAEREIAAALVRFPEPLGRVPVEMAMRRPAPTCSSEDQLGTVMRRLTGERLRHLVVMDGGRILGIVSVGDIVKNRLEQVRTEAGVLRDYVAAHRATH